MRSLFPFKIFFKGPSFSSSLPLHLERSELPLIIKEHSEEVVKEEKTKEELFEEKFAKCIAVNCPKLDVGGMTGCKCYPGYEHVHWGHGKRCFAAPFEERKVAEETKKKKVGQQKQHSGGPNVGYRIRGGKSGRNKHQESVPTTVVKATKN